MVCNLVFKDSLGRDVKTQICEDIRNLPDLCRSLDNLDIAISFLKTTGGQPEDMLDDFMSKTLQIEQPMCSQKVICYAIVDICVCLHYYLHQYRIMQK